MTLLKNINEKAKSYLSSGFGSNTDSYRGRFVNKNGTTNVEKRGVHFWNRISWYHTLIYMSVSNFLLIILIFYLTINFAFALFDY
jgi:hypothetical protein